MEYNLLFDDDVMHYTRKITVIVAVVLMIGINACPPLSVQGYTLDNGELRRHAPITGNITVNETRLEEMILSINRSNMNNTELNDILDRMYNALEQGDGVEYNKSAVQLERYLKTQYPKLKDNRELLYNLLYLATTRLGYGVIYDDRERYHSLLEFIESKNAEEMSRRLEDVMGQNQTAEEYSQHRSNNSVLPYIKRGNYTAPNIRNLSSNTFKSTLKLVVPSFIVLITLYLAYHRRRNLRLLLLGIAGRIIQRKASGLTRHQGEPRESVFRCVETLLRILSLRGFKRDRWETIREFFNRVDGLTRIEFSLITGLYERARYSRHNITLDESKKCFDCVERLTRNEL